jgi:hypothetical protein
MALEEVALAFRGGDGGHDTGTVTEARPVSHPAVESRLRSPHAMMR